MSKVVEEEQRVLSQQTNSGEWVNAENPSWKNKKAAKNNSDSDSSDNDASGDEEDDVDDDLDDNQRELPRRLGEILLEKTQPVVLSLFSEFDFGDPVSLPRDTTASSYSFAYLLTWDLVFDMVRSCPLFSERLRHGLTSLHFQPKSSVGV